MEEEEWPMRNSDASLPTEKHNTKLQLLGVARRSVEAQ